MPPVKVGDLNLSRSIGGAAMTKWVGTVTYMAPEVMMDDSYGFPADVFS